MFLGFIVILFSFCTKIKKKNKVLICRGKGVNLVNLKLAVVLFSLYLKLNKLFFDNNSVISTMHYNIDMKFFNKIKFILVFFRVIILLKTKYSFIFFTNFFGRFLVTKTLFFKIFYLNKRVRSIFLFLKHTFIRYYNFYKQYTHFYSVFFIKCRISFLKLIDFISLFKTYHKYFFINKKILKRVAGKKFKLKNFITKYCRNFFNFKKYRIANFFKKTLLFLKKSILYIFKYKLPFYLSKLGSSYKIFLRKFVKKRNLSAGVVDEIINSLLSKITFSNFLKSSSKLNFLYKMCYYNIYLKKIKYNFYITITNRKGDVIFSNSSGKVGLLKKKQKKSMFATNLVVRPAIKVILRLNILSIKNFFCPIPLKRIFLNVKYFFLRSGVIIEHIVIFNNRPHNFYYKKLKKQKRV